MTLLVLISNDELHSINDPNISIYYMYISANIQSDEPPCIQGDPTEFNSGNIFFYIRFDSALSIFSMASLKQHMEYFNFRSYIQLDLSVQIYTETAALKTFIHIQSIFYPPCSPRVSSSWVWRRRGWRRGPCAALSRSSSRRRAPACRRGARACSSTSSSSRDPRTDTKMWTHQKVNEAVKCVMNSKKSTLSKLWGIR